jgi:hypothetical protein
MNFLSPTGGVITLATQMEDVLILISEDFSNLSVLITIFITQISTLLEKEKSSPPTALFPQTPNILLPSLKSTTSSPFVLYNLNNLSWKYFCSRFDWKPNWLTFQSQRNSRVPKIAVGGPVTTATPGCSGVG